MDLNLDRNCSCRGLFLIPGRGTSDTMSATPKAPHKRKNRQERD